MESLMRFGRDGCRAVLEHYRDWVALKGGNGDMDDTRNQIAYSRTAEEEWFCDLSPRGKMLQDVWNNRIKNRDPARGCLRKVNVKFVHLSPTPFVNFHPANSTSMISR